MSDQDASRREQVELVAAILAGKKSWRELYLRYAKAVRRICQKAGRHAEDAFQDTWTRVLHLLATIRDAADLDIVQIAHNVSRNYQRVNERDEALCAPHDPNKGRSSPWPGPEDVIIFLDDVALIEEARRGVRLEGGCTYSEIYRYRRDLRLSMAALMLVRALPPKHQPADSAEWQGCPELRELMRDYDGNWSRKWVLRVSKHALGSRRDINDQTAGCAECKPRWRLRPGAFGLAALVIYSLGRVRERATEHVVQLVASWRAPIATGQAVAEKLLGGTAALVLAAGLTVPGVGSDTSGSPPERSAPPAPTSERHGEAGPYGSPNPGGAQASSTTGPGSTTTSASGPRSGPASVTTSSIRSSVPSPATAVTTGRGTTTSTTTARPSLAGEAQPLMYASVAAGAGTAGAVSLGLNPTACAGVRVGTVVLGCAPPTSATPGIEAQAGGTALPAVTISLTGSQKSF